MTPQQFIAKWTRANLSERSACQQHFLDLCELLGQPKPAEADPDGAWYTFERGVRKTTGGKGWADVWMRGRFGWEYKGKHKDLAAAYQQLLLYREDLENPPLLVVCDLDRFEVHTNFTGTAKEVHAFDLAGLGETENLDILRRVFSDPESLRPGQTTESITRQAAEQFGQLADGLRTRGVPAAEAAHFLMKLMFCMFGEDIGLLPSEVFSQVLRAGRDDPQRLTGLLESLFQAMSQGGYFGADEILWFNGGLFADTEVIELRRQEIESLIRVNDYDWASVEPSIFGTLFERTLDPAKRSQIGAHYTSREDIVTLLEPVVMQPLRREWEEVKQKCDKLGERAAAAKTTATKRNRLKDRDKALRDFVEHLAHVSILDPACGSGNFLYVAINLLLDLEKEVIAYAATRDLGLLPQVRPTQLAGIEINPYAQQLAQVVIWIGYLQWMHHNGFSPPRHPVLEPIESIRLMDAILDLSDPENPREPEWPPADFIVGNPPFLGGKLMRRELGDAYLDSLFEVWKTRVRPEADLCCYWFENSRAQLVKGKTQRVGLLGTQGIRGGANRETLKRVQSSGNIFFAISDREWVLDGAHVHISMVGFDQGNETSHTLDGLPVEEIHSNLTSQANVTQAKKLPPNASVGFMGDTKGGSFDIAFPAAKNLLLQPNPHGKPNSDVIVPWTNGMDVTRRSRDMWIIDFGVECEKSDAACYDLPFAHVMERVFPIRKNNKRQSYREKFYLHVEPRIGMRTAISSLERFLATTTVSKHRLFVWMTAPTLPDHQLIVFARDDDYFFGVLHSRFHEVWALRAGTRLETRPRYTPTTCFDTFPFPEPTAQQREAIAQAAAELDRLRNNWLNPPEWTRTEILEFPGTVGGPWDRYLDKSQARQVGGVDDAFQVAPVRYPRLAPLDDQCAKELKRRTLTNLYNERPTWLDLAHQRLDAAVAAAYGWPADLPEEQILQRLLELNLAHAAQQP